MNGRDEVFFIIGVVVGAIGMVCLVVPARGQDVGISGEDGGYALRVQNLNTIGSWIVCAGGEKPLVTVTKSATDDAYRIVIECPNQPATVVPTS